MAGRMIVIYDPTSRLQVEGNPAESALDLKIASLSVDEDITPQQAAAVSQKLADMLWAEMKR
jgi:hypothetical protein